MGRVTRAVCPPRGPERVAGTQREGDPSNACMGARGEECARHTMDHCQACAEACRRCAEACREMSGAALTR